MQKQNRSFSYFILLFLGGIFFIHGISSCAKEKKINAAGLKMQDFLCELSAYTRSYKSNFILLPQNGMEVVFENIDPEREPDARVMAAIDGFGVEELFEAENAKDSEYRVKMCDKIRQYRTITVADYLKKTSADDFYARCGEHHFIGFPRMSNNYSYEHILTPVKNENADNVTSLSAIRNFLYLISNNQYGSKTEMLNALRATNFDMLIIDAFFEEELWTAAEINSLKTKANGGKRIVLAYMNIGAAEKYRYYYQDHWKLRKPKFLKKKYPGYEDEIFVEFWDQQWKDIIYGNDDSYAKKIINASFDGVFLDNIEAYYSLYKK